MHRVGEVLRGVTSVLLGQNLRSLPNVTVSPIPISRSSVATDFEGLVKFCRTDAPAAAPKWLAFGTGHSLFCGGYAAVVFLN